MKLVKLSKTQTNGSFAIDRLNVLERYKLFREDREQVEDNQQPGRPSTTKYDENTVNA